jgi:predicted amidohydrolase
VEAGLTYAGSSCITGPEGLLMAAASTQTLLMADLEKAAQERARAAAPYLRDRRPDLYRI